MTLTIENVSSRHSTIPRDQEGITLYCDADNDFARVDYPFYGLKFWSHVQPRWILVRLAMTIKKMYKSEPGAVREMFHSLGEDERGDELVRMIRMCMAIFDNWTQEVNTLPNDDLTQWMRATPDIPDDSPSSSDSPSGSDSDSPSGCHSPTGCHSPSGRHLPSGSDSYGRTTPERVLASNSLVISVQPVVPRKRARRDKRKQACRDNDNLKKAAGPSSLSVSSQTGPQTPLRRSTRSHHIIPSDGMRRSNQANPSGAQGAGIPQTLSQTLPHASHYSPVNTGSSRARASGQHNLPDNQSGWWAQPQDSLSRYSSSRDIIPSDRLRHNTVTQANPFGDQGARIPQRGVGSQTLPHASNYRPINTGSSRVSDQHNLPGNQGDGSLQQVVGSQSQAFNNIKFHNYGGGGHGEQNRGSNHGSQDRRRGTTGGKWWD